MAIETAFLSGLAGRTQSWQGLEAGHPNSLRRN
jgi:hypothetical protein